MRIPSVVSSNDMPAVNSSGKIKMSATGRPFPASTAAMPSKPTSVAVSKPTPKRTPIGYIFQLASTSLISGRNKRPINPRCCSISSTEAPSHAFCRPALRNARTMSSRTARLIPATKNKKTAEIDVPMTSPVCCKPGRCVLTAPAPIAIATLRATTMLEWPSEKYKPTATGRWPSCISFRVTLSIAEI